jgi:hypothetical protein
MQRGPRPGVASLPSNEERDARTQNVKGTQAENDEPQPHPPVEFGFLNVNPEPCIEL